MGKKKLYRALWAKSDRETGKIHLVHYHLFESAAVAQILWNDVFSESLKNEISALLEVDIEKAGKILAYWVGLHDIGKISPVFQAKNQTQRKKLEALGFDFPKYMDDKTYHSLVGARFLNLAKKVPRFIAIAISGHHGNWSAIHGIEMQIGYGRSEIWNNSRKDIMNEIKKVIAPCDFSNFKIEDESKKNIFTTWFTGLICVADWISSNTDLFDYCDELIDFQVYYSNAIKQAKISLEKTGWMGWRSTGEVVSFEEMYDGFTPRTIQKEVFDAYDEFSSKEHFLMIVEAPTGIGKTEIAMYVADQWLQTSLGNGLYIAMPTQATSNQIYQRTIKILRDRYPREYAEDDQKLVLVLAHGQAAWNKDLHDLRVKGVEGVSDDEDNLKGNVVVMDWFQNNRKQALLAPFGVGTVDQVFLSILQTKHFFVRLFGLKNKLVIFDEIHAYDTYMNVLFERLLHWLAGLGVSVIILSATLAEEGRKSIVQAYCGTSEISNNNDYPRLTLASKNKPAHVIPLSWKEKDRELKISWLEDSSLEICLKDKLVDGGCAAVICNTVREAQEIYLHLVKADLKKNTKLILFHARFPFAWRKEIEENVLEKFGKNSSHRPNKAIVIATQVIEQSLDIDFDFMITALAPIDLILQRAGRLHRHKRKKRPKNLQKPELTIIKPKTNEQTGEFDFGGSGYVYDKSILFLSWKALKEKNILHVVADTRGLISSVYNDSKQSFLNEQERKFIQRLQLKEKNERTKAKRKAKSGLIMKTDSERYLTEKSFALKETDDPAVHTAYRASTRDIDSSMSIICLFEGKEGKLYFSPYSRGRNFDLATVLEQNDIAELFFGNAVNIGSQGIINDILKSTSDRILEIDELKYLRYYKILLFDENGRFDTEKYQFEIYKDVGLFWNKKNYS